MTKQDSKTNWQNTQGDKTQQELMDEDLSHGPALDELRKSQTWRNQTPDNQIVEQAKAKWEISKEARKSRKSDVEDDQESNQQSSSLTPSTNRNELIEALEACIEWIKQSQEDLEAQAVQIIDQKLSDHVKKSQVFLILAIQKRMDSLVRLLDAADAIEARLLSPEIIRKMEGDDLRKSLDLIEKKSENIIGQILSMIEQSGVLPKAFDDDAKLPYLQHQGKQVFTDPKRREAMRSRLDKLLKDKKK